MGVGAIRALHFYMGEKEVGLPLVHLIFTPYLALN
jgi:hypothetical protein